MSAAHDAAALADLDRTITQGGGKARGIRRFSFRKFAREVSEVSTVDFKASSSATAGER